MTPIYVDFDQTLVYAVYGRNRKFERFAWRPWTREFLLALHEFGPVAILTASEGGWARDGINERPDLRDLIQKIITLEDMVKIQMQLDAIYSIEGLSQPEYEELVGLIQPILPPGAVFDDAAYGSDVYLLKSAAVGIFGEKDLWFRVPEFARRIPDAGGLEQAFLEFRKRNERKRRKNPHLGLVGAP